MKTSQDQGVTVGVSDLGALSVAYEEARAAGVESFEYRGAILLTEYAKYLIAYLEQVDAVSHGLDQEEAGPDAE